MNSFNSPVPLMTSASLSSSTHDLLREAMEGRHHHLTECTNPCPRRKWRPTDLRDRFRKYTSRQ